MISYKIEINLSFCILFHFFAVPGFSESLGPNKKKQSEEIETEKEKIEADSFSSQDRKHNIHITYGESSSSNTENVVKKKAKTVDGSERVVSRSEQ